MSRAVQQSGSIVNEAIPGILAVLVVLTFMIMLVQDQQPPDILIIALGLVIGHYFRRQGDNDMLNQSERVLRVQSLEEVRALGRVT